MAFGTQYIVNKANRELQLSIPSHFRKKVERLNRSTSFKVNKSALAKVKKYSDEEWNLEKDKTLYSDEGANPYSLRDFRSDDEEEYQALVLNRG